MAKRATIKVVDEDLKKQDVDGSVVSDYSGLAKVEGRWTTIHLPTGKYLSGPGGFYDQKRKCLLFAEHLAGSDINWNFETNDEMLKLNTVEKLSEVRTQALKKAFEE